MFKKLIEFKKTLKIIYNIIKNKVYYFYYNLCYFKTDISKYKNFKIFLKDKIKTQEFF
jgi:hypothetical protein